MHGIFGIEPEAVNNWADLRYIVEKFGFSKGLLIARYPRRWMAMVMDACIANGVRDVDLRRVEEKLRQIKQDRLFKMGMSYESADSWAENVAQQEILDYLAAVIVRTGQEGEKFVEVDAVPEAIFENRREMRVKRTAQALAGAAACLLADASILTLIDPYFKPKPKNIKVLKAMIELSQEQGHRLKTIVIYTSFNRYPVTSDQLEQEYRRSLVGCLGEGMTLVVYRVDDAANESDFHARYLLTESAGLRYDRGFVEPEAHSQREQETDVVCMENALVEELLGDSPESIGAFSVYDRIELGGSV